jgi:hypothetical protein
MESKEYRYQTFRLTVVNGTIINSNNEDFLRLDSGFNKLRGVSIIQVSDGGIPNNFQVGIRFDRKKVIDPVNIQHWSAAYVAPQDKFLLLGDEKDGGIPYGDGEKLYVSVINQAALTANLTIEMTAWLVLDLTENQK